MMVQNFNGDPRMEIMRCVKEWQDSNNAVLVTRYLVRFKLGYHNLLVIFIPGKFTAASGPLLPSAKLVVLGRPLIVRIFYLNFQQHRH